LVREPPKLLITKKDDAANVLVGDESLVTEDEDIPPLIVIK